MDASTGASTGKQHQRRPQKPWSYRPVRSMNRSHLPHLLFSLTAAALLLLAPSPRQAQADLPTYCSPAANIMIVLDISGSMRGSPWQDAKTAIRDIMERHPTAHYGLVLFSSRAWLEVPLEVGNEAEIVAALNRNSPSGATNIVGGMNVARDELASKLGDLPFRDLQSLIVMITDGAPNAGGCTTAACLRQVAADLLNPGITVDGQQHSVLTFVIGFLQGVDPNILRAMAEGGGTGDYAQANNLAELQNAMEAMMALVPSEEICDGYDNNCNGLIDDGLNPDPNDPPPEFWCDTGMPGECALGYRWCENGAWVCIPFNLPQPEVCDGRDNDCDGFIDGTDLNGDGILQPEESLRNLCGGCGPTPQEVCNGLDDDCDGVIDNGAECPGDLVCSHGMCAQACAAGECPPGLICLDDMCLEPCLTVECAPGEACDAQTGACYDPCEGITCEEGTTCIGGLCGNCYDDRTNCPDGTVCVYPGVCQGNPCADVTCGFNEFCRALPGGDSECLPSCAPVACSGPTTCIDGECIEDHCAVTQCLEFETCLDGECYADPCIGFECEQGQLCSAVMRQDGALEAFCIDDPCAEVDCPTGQVCQVACPLGVCTGRCIYEDLAEPPDDGHDDGGDGEDDGHGTPPPYTPGSGSGGPEPDPEQDEPSDTSGSGLGCSCAITGPGTGNRGGRSGAAADGLLVLLFSSALTLFRSRPHTKVWPAGQR